MQRGEIFAMRMNIAGFYAEISCNNKLSQTNFIIIIIDFKLFNKAYKNVAANAKIF